MLSSLKDLTVKIQCQIGETYNATLEEEIKFILKDKLKWMPKFFWKWMLRTTIRWEHTQMKWKDLNGQI